MSSSDTVANYLMRITQILDQLVTISETMDDIKLVNVALSGLHESWEPFVQGICAQVKLPTFDRLCTNCIEEEARLESRSAKQKGSSDENQALLARASKGTKGSYPKREV
jgi:hypothetical protein